MVIDVPALIFVLVCHRDILLPGFYCSRIPVMPFSQARTLVRIMGNSQGMLDTMLSYISLVTTIMRKGIPVRHRSLTPEITAFQLADFPD